MSVDIQSKHGNTLFWLYYYGAVEYFQRQPYIVDVYNANGETIPCKIVAKDIDTGEEILLFDGYKHGYDGMFCEEFDPEKVAQRTLTKYDMPPCKIHIDFGYSIDYEDEIEIFNIDENNRVTLMNGESISWEEVKRNGYDYISITCQMPDSKQIQIVSLELA